MRRCVKAINSLFISNKNKIIPMKFFYTALIQKAPCLQLEWQISKETLFNQQRRDYVPTVKQEKCWSCKKELNCKKIEMLCPHCGFLQEVKEEISYFRLLDFPQKFDLDIQALTKRFRQLQTIVHPDKFSNKSSREQLNSDDWSSLINKAYNTLSIPIKRGQYLLELNGINMPQDNSALDKEFLLEMMERNEEVEDAKTKNELIAINERLKEELKEKITLLGKIFTEKNLDKAKTILIEMKYLISIQNTVKNKLLTFLDV